MGRRNREDGPPDPFRLVSPLSIIQAVPVLDEIAKLLRLPEAGTDAPSLDRVEQTLTEGYAHALALDAEKLRLERRLGALARVANTDAPEVAEELAYVAERVASTQGELTRLRAVLASLQARASELRAASESTS